VHFILIYSAPIYNHQFFGTSLYLRERRPCRITVQASNTRPPFRFYFRSSARGAELIAHSTSKSSRRMPPPATFHIATTDIRQPFIDLRVLLNCPRMLGNRDSMNSIPKFSRLFPNRLSSRTIELRRHRTPTTFSAPKASNRYRRCYPQNNPAAYTY